MTTRRPRGRLAAPGRRLTRIALLVAGLALVAASCGKKESATGSGTFQGTPPTGGTTSTSAAAPTTAANEKPKFGSEYERTCSDGLGFSGVAAYSRTAGGVHPTVLMTNTDGATWTVDVPFEGYPAGWILGYADDASKAQLVACYERTKSFPAGKTCQMTDDKTKQPFTLTMYNTEYRLRVLVAQTGQVLYDKTGQAKSTECPTLTYTSGGQDRTKYYTDASDTDYRGILKQFIAP